MHSYIIGHPPYNGYTCFTFRYMPTSCNFSRDNAEDYAVYQDGEQVGTLQYAPISSGLNPSMDPRHYIVFNDKTWRYVPKGIYRDYLTENHDYKFMLEEDGRLDITEHRMRYTRPLLIAGQHIDVELLSPAQTCTIVSSIKKTVEHSAESMTHPLHETLLDLLGYYHNDLSARDHLYAMIYYKADCPYNRTLEPYNFTINDVHMHYKYLEKLYSMSIALSVRMIEKPPLELWDFMDSGYYLYTPKHLTEIIRAGRWENLAPTINYARGHGLPVNYQQIFIDVINYKGFSTMPADIFRQFIKNCDKRELALIATVLERAGRADLISILKKHRSSPLAKVS